ncbi:uncharacterized protein LOC143011172 isoform X2 [Genypterus blacodes]|uniref:uncharacterized protein LOC143011172 isoform X2 n=1 Tax=Genypterus blacodes TaxID=154954 RepID=UPI003F758379
MIRRSRISVRPNVSTRPSVSTGKPAAPAAPQDGPPQSQETGEAHTEGSESNTAVTVAAVGPSETKAAAGDGNEQTTEGTSSPAALQRRKRFTVKPKVIPGRTPISARTPKSPAKAVSEPSDSASPDHDKPTTSSQTGTTTPRLRSPSRRRLSEESAPPKEQPKPTGPSSAISGSSVGDSSDQPQLKQNEDTTVKENGQNSQAKEDPSRPPDKVFLSVPDREAREISEKAKTLVSSERRQSTLPPKCSLSRLLNDPSDLQRLEKARKLRELLKQEIHKEKKLRRKKSCVKEYTLDPAKMTMRDLIHYLPLSNPMTSALEESGQENETVVAPSPEREDSPERAQEPSVPADAPKTSPSLPSQREEGEEEEEEEEDGVEAEAGAGAEEDDDGLMVPQVKVAEDGSLIIDEESLTVEVQRAKGPNPFGDRDPIFERGSTTTYSSFRKGTYTKPWSNEETDMFFLAISMVGTDFSMVCQLFPHRARSEIKNKFKKEERQNGWRIDKAFKEKRKLDIEYFSKLLEKILEYQKNKKKLKSLTEKNTPKKRSRKPKGKKAARKLSDVEEEEEEHEALDLEEEDGEKENEGGSPASQPKRKRKRKDKNEASTEEPNNMEDDDGGNSEQGDACVPEDAEAALPQDHTESDMLEETPVKAAKGATVRLVELSRGRALKPQLALARKRATKHPTPPTKPNDSTSDVQDESTADEGLKKQVCKDASPSRPAKVEKLSADDISEGEDSSVMPPRPTRYGRLPKPTRHLNYPAKEDAHASAPESPPGSASPAASAKAAAKTKPKCTAKRARASKPTLSPKSKKPKLVTLRASQSEYSDEEDESQREEEELEEGQNPPSGSNENSSAPVFVPVGLRSPEPVIAQVEETMEELDILASVPDVLGMSHDPLCPDAACEQVQDETGIAGPCEHQLDLLVDVIDFLSSDHVEVSQDEIYNEAAQTLLTIGHLGQSAQNPTCTEDDASGSTSVVVTETCGQQPEEIPLKPAAREVENVAPADPAASEHAVTDTPLLVNVVETEHCITDSEPPSQTGDVCVTEKSEETCEMQQAVSEMDPVPQLESSSDISKKNSMQTRRGCSLKLKPKPNLGHTSRITKSASQPERSPVRTLEESHTAALDPFQDTRSQSAPNETFSEMADFGPASLTDEPPCTEIKMPEEPSESQENTPEGQPGIQLEPDLATSAPSCSFSGQATTPQSTDEELKSTPVNPESSDSAVTESQVVSNTIDPNPVQEDSERSPVRVTPVDQLSTSQKEDSEHSPTCVTPVDQLSTSQKEDSEHSPTCVTPVDQLSTSQNADSAAPSTCQSRKTRFPKVKPKPNLRQASRAVHSKGQVAEVSVTHLEAVKKSSSPTTNPESSISTVAQAELQSQRATTPHDKTLQSNSPTSVQTQPLDLGSTERTTEESSAVEEAKTNIVPEDRPASSSETSEQHVPEKQRQKVTPNLASSPRTRRSQLQLVKDSNRGEQHHMDSLSHGPSEPQPYNRNSTLIELESTENINDVLTSSCSTNSDKPESDRTVQTTNSKAVFSERIRTEDSTAPASKHEQEIPASTPESNTKPTEHPSDVSEVQTLDVGSTRSKLESLPHTNEHTEPDEKAQQPSLEGTSREAVQQCLPGSSETTHTVEDSLQATQSTSEPTHSSKSSKTAPHTRRGRLPKPKPNLGRSVRPPQRQAAQNATQPESDSAPHSVTAGGEISPDIQKPVDGAVEQLGNQATPQDDAGCSPTQTPGHSAQSQEASTPFTGGTQNCPNLVVFQDRLQAPSEQEEQFFILSLTEIPVSSSEQAAGSGSEPLLCPSVADNTPLQQQRLAPTLISQAAPEQSLAAGGEEPLSNVVEPGPIEESGTENTGPDGAASSSSVTEKPVDPRERTTVQPEVPETEERAETDVPLKNRRVTGRRAKLQVKPIITKKQASKTVTAQEAELIPTQSNSDRESELHCPSVQPQTFVVPETADSNVLTEPQKGSCDHEDTLMHSGVKAQTSHSLTQSTVTRNLNRKPKGFLSFLSEKTSSASLGSPPPTKAALRGPKVRAPQRKRSLPAPTASTPQDAISSPSITPAVQSPSPPTVSTRTQVEAKRAPEPTSASLCTDVSASQQSDHAEGGSVEDEPTNVSQYFLSDIFTEVDED